MISTDLIFYLKSTNGDKLYNGAIPENQVK